MAGISKFLGQQGKYSSGAYIGFVADTQGSSYNSVSDGEEKQGYISSGKVYLKNDYPNIVSAIGSAQAYKGNRIVSDIGLTTKQKGSKILYANGKYIVGFDGFGACTATSTDLSTWTEDRPNQLGSSDFAGGVHTSQCINLWWDGTNYVAVFRMQENPTGSTWNAHVKYSTDGTNWTYLDRNTNNLNYSNIISAAPGPTGVGMIHFGHYNGTMQYTNSNPGSWSNQSLQSTDAYGYGMAYDSSLSTWCIVGKLTSGGTSANSYGFSATRTTGSWTDCDTNTQWFADNSSLATAGASTNNYSTQYPRTVTSNNNGTFVLGGDNGMLKYSNDGLEWTSLNSPTNSSIFNIKWTGSYYILLANDGTIAYSENVTDWKKITLGSYIKVKDFTIGPSNELLFITSKFGGEIYSISSINSTTYYADGFNPSTEFYLGDLLVNNFEISGVQDGYSTLNLKQYVKV